MAWDKSAASYTKFCKSYYVNMLLSNRLQQMVEQQNDLVSRLKNKEAEPNSQYLLDLHLVKQIGSKKMSRGNGRAENQ